MTQKNTLHALVLVCTIAAPSYSPYSLYAAQKPQESMQNIPSSLMTDDEEFDEEEELEETEEEEQAEPERKIVSRTKKVFAPEPSFFTKMYNVITPIMLVALSGAIATAIATGTKSLIKLLLAKEQFRLQKNAVFAQVEKAISSARSEDEKEAIIQEYSAYLNSLAQKEEQNKPFNILTQVMFVSTLNLFIPLLGEMIRMGSLVGLQSLMPTKK